MAERRFPTWASDSVADIGNGDPNKADPGTSKQAAGFSIEKPSVQTFNWLLNLIGHFVKANNTIAEKSHTYELEAGERILADNLASAPTVYLPTSPQEGQWVEIGGLGKYSTYPVVVDGGSRDVMLLGDKVCTLDVDGIVFMFYWSTSRTMWIIRKVNQDGE